MVFSFDNPHATSPLPWKPRETEIEPLEIAEPASASPSPTPSPSLSPKPTKAVKWVTESTLSPSVSVTSIKPPPYSEIAQISDLCLAFKDYSGTTECMGYIIDDATMHHHIYPVVHPPYAELPAPISLYKRLTTPTSKLTRKERLQLALTLAASVLQLHKTPWLNERFTKNDILFLNSTSGPYVSRSFLSTPPPPPEKTTPKTLPIVRNETIFALGVLLIELCLGHSLESLRLEEDLSPDAKLTDYMTARRLVSEVYDEGGGRYGDAVRRCIHCEFDQRKASLDVEGFRECFFRGVVVPLEQDWGDFCSMGGRRL
jgi:hypothetical protein